MRLSRYVRAIIHESTTYTADFLDVDAHLYQTFHGMLRRSERDVRERGVNSRPRGAPDFRSVTADAGRLNQAVFDLSMEDDPFATAIGNAPGAAAGNSELANRYGHEYYRGALGNGASRVTLQSNRAFGSWLASWFWSSDGDPWF